MARRINAGVKSFVSSIMGKTRRKNPKGEKRAKKRESDSVRVRYQHNPKVLELIKAKGETVEAETSSYDKDAFIDHCLELYGEGKKHDLQTNRQAIEDTLERVELVLKKHQLELSGDAFDRQLVRDYLLIEKNINPKGNVEEYHSGEAFED